MIRKRYLATCLLSLSIAACSSDSDNDSSSAPLPPQTETPGSELDTETDVTAGEALDPDATPVEGEAPIDGEAPIPGEEIPDGEIPVEGEIAPDDEVLPGEEVPPEGEVPIVPPAVNPEAGLIGPSGGVGGGPYAQFNDSPFVNIDFSAPGYFYLENFEDQFLEHPGASANAGGFVTDSTLNNHDSVDADDGLIDGNSLNGESWFRGGGFPTVTWTFNAANLGGNLPTHVGVVWTDGQGTIEFEAFGADGQSLGVVTGTHADMRFDGATAEDRFYGVINDGGIRSIRLSNSSTSVGLELDHLQWGYVAP